MKVRDKARQKEIQSQVKLRQTRRIKKSKLSNSRCVFG